MSDYIKREEIVNHLERMRDAGKNSDMTFALNCALGAVFAICPADVVERPRWIPVTERLPEMYQPVLTFDGEFHAVEMRVPFILDDDGNQIKSDWWVDADNDINAEYYKGLRDGAASYWMPLPQPPKEGRDMSEKKPHWLYDGDCVICQCCRKAYDISTNADRSIPTVCPFCGSGMDMEEVLKA